MAEREQDSRITELYNSGVNVYSFSKLSTINDCLYSAYLTYIKHKRGGDSAYSRVGSIMHDALQSIVDDENDESCLTPALKKAIEEVDFEGLSFPKDFRGGDSIRQRYIKNLELFCNDFKKPNGNYKTEELLIYRVSTSRAIIGYSDLIRFYQDGTVQVLDWKTSSLYKSSDLLDHGRQLVIYTMALEQLGYKTRPPAWIFLKYVEVEYKDLRGKTISKICERSKLYDAIGYMVMKRMEQGGVDDLDADAALHKFQSEGTMKYIPEFVRAQFKIKPYVLYYDVTDELRKECVDYINRIADLFERLDKDNEAAWEPCNIDKSHRFFCEYLCGHSGRCQALQELHSFGDNKKEKDDDLDLL